MRNADRGEGKNHEVTDDVIDEVMDDMIDDVTDDTIDDMTEQELCLPTVTDSPGTASSPQWTILKLQLTGDQASTMIILKLQLTGDWVSTTDPS